MFALISHESEIPKIKSSALLQNIEMNSFDYVQASFIAIF